MSHETRWPSRSVTDVVMTGPDGEIAFEYTPSLYVPLSLMCEHGTTVETSVTELADVLRDLLQMTGNYIAADLMVNVLIPAITKP